MLEVKNVTKIYKSKGGVTTRALDGVSVCFPETGLVFLLGKSGSGKSTLLNVCGGLDEPTEGEIIVKGRSSKTFSGSDFDSYRNTFIGFVFQEYNILDEFNVEDNIALALELQGKKKDGEKISAILRDVELETYAKRKPSTLSGGQKQRIAIARALVKDPQIIMADEPTGALDSATGKQVFDTLKHLSKSRLVIVVSHDREFAEVYGDRIIELMDGKIISDVTKSSVPAKVIDENVCGVGEDTLKIKCGEKLTESNFAAIKKFLKESEGDIILSRGTKAVSAVSKALKIDAEGSSERFDDTDPEAIELKQYGAEDSKFIRSRLPASKAIKIGASGLKLKPIRLLFTIFLSIVAFTMFGLFSTMMLYDGDKVAVKSFASSGYSYLNICKMYEVRTTWEDGEQSSYGRQTTIRDAEVEKLDKIYGGVLGFYQVNASAGNIKLEGKKENSRYYSTQIEKCAFVPATHPFRSKIKGRYPEKDDELCISSYLLEVMKNSTVYAVNEEGGFQDSDKYTVNSETDVIGKRMLLTSNGDSQAFTVTGVFDEGAVPSKYEPLKNDKTQNFLLEYEFSSFISESMHLMVLGTQNLCDRYRYNPYGSNYHEYFEYCANSLEMCYKTLGLQYGTDEWQETDNSTYLSSYVRNYDAEERLPITWFKGKSSLSKNEMVIGLENIVYSSDILNGQLYEILKEENPEASREQLIDLVNTSINSLHKDWEIYYTGSAYDDVLSEYRDYTDAERKEAYKRIEGLISKLDVIEVELNIDNARKQPVSVAGIYIPPLDVDFSRGIYLNQQFIDDYITVYSYNNYREETNYKPIGDERYVGVFVPYDGTENAASEILSSTGAATKDASDVYFELDSTLYDTIVMTNEMVEVLKFVFLGIGLACAVFAALLMFNFISMSISNKRKEIGILRAVGARGTDVFRIFFSESGIIAGICLVISLIASALVTFLINGVLKSELGLDVTLLVFGINSVLIMTAIALFVAVIATFLPVYFAARKKPVEAIRAL